MIEEMYPFYAIYTNGKYTGTDFIDVCKRTGDLTLELDYFNSNYVPDKDETVFNEIKMLNPEDKILSEYEYLLDEMPLFDGDLNEWARETHSKLKNFLKNVLNQDKKYMFIHSAGYDSRILSGILAELRNEGYEWDIHFRCHQPEGDGFNKIMRIEGWDEKQYSVFRGPKVGHYDIGNPNQPMYGWMSYKCQMNFWRDIIENENDYIMISGLGGGERFSYPALGKSTPTNYDYCDNKILNRWLNFFRDRGKFCGYWQNMFDELLLPYMSYDYIEMSCKAREEWIGIYDNRLDYVRKALIEEIDVDLLNIDWQRHDYNWSMEESRKDEMERFWMESKLLRDYNLQDIDIKNWDKHSQCIFGLATCYEVVNTRYIPENGGFE